MVIEKGKIREEGPAGAGPRWHKSQRYNDWGVWEHDWQLGRVFGHVRMKNEERDARAR
jgi:hypothetical protein